MHAEERKDVSEVVEVETGDKLLKTCLPVVSSFSCFPPLDFFGANAPRGEKFPKSFPSHADFFAV
jgi:hypothetical protein